MPSNTSSYGAWPEVRCQVDRVRGHPMVKTMLAAGLVIAVLLLPSATVRGAAAVAKDGETIELEGRVALVEGLNIQERPVVYVALRLDLPITYTDGMNSEDNIR